MSSIKEYMFDLEMQRADEWVRSQLDDYVIDEDSEEYQSLLQDYADMKQAEYDAAEWQAELDWLKDNGSSILHKEFIEQLTDLREMANSNLADSVSFHSAINTRLVINMTYAYAVTLLEAFLGETLKALLNENTQYLTNAISNVEQLKKAKYGLSELRLDNVTVQSLATRKISEEILFHNIPKVMVVFGQVLGRELPIDFSQVNKIKDVRHDIVHRNAKTIDGVPIHINFDQLQGALNSIQKFASDLQLEINEITS